MMSTHCFYHGADLDGHCSGAIVKANFPEAIMHPINYGDRFPWEIVNPCDTVWMVDFALQPDTQMIKLHDLLADNGELLWIDHHASRANLRTDMFHWSGSFDVSRAACELAWEFINKVGTPVPIAVRLLSLYDSWTYQGHHLENMVLPFQIRMRMEELDPLYWNDNEEDWKILFGFNGANEELRMVGEFVEEGEFLLAYDNQQKKKYLQTYGFETRIWGRRDAFMAMEYKAIAVNLGHTSSKVFDSVWDPEKYDLMLTFCRRPDQQWNVSLYSTKDDIDCGAVAKFYGGGGHKGAAGFQCKELPFKH